VPTDRGQVFCRCGRADDEPAFPRFPMLPVLTCPGHEEAELGEAPPRPGTTRG